MLQCNNFVVGYLLLYVPQFSKISALYSNERYGRDSSINKLFCGQLRSCNERSFAIKQKVCGFDSRNDDLKLFENKCQMLKENCDKKTSYFAAKIEACTMKDEFLSDNGNSSVDWEHGHDGFNISLLNLTKPIVIHNAHGQDLLQLKQGLINSTAYRSGSTETARTTTPTSAAPVQVYKFSKSSCFLFRDCSQRVNIDPICGKNYKTNTLEMFDNLCLMYKHNCDNMTWYYEADIKECINKGIFAENANSGFWEPALDFDIHGHGQPKDKHKKPGAADADNNEKFFQLFPDLAGAGVA